MQHTGYAGLNLRFCAEKLIRFEIRTGSFQQGFCNAHIAPLSGNIQPADFSGAVCLVLGSEGFGISRLIREKCDFIVSIPLYGNVNSMNVSCAGAVLFAEIAKQKHQNGGK